MTGFKLQDVIAQWAKTTADFLDKVTVETLSEKFAAEWIADTFLDEKAMLAAVYKETGYVGFVPIESMFMVLPGTGLTSGLHQLFWAYVSVSEKITVAVSERDVWTRQFIQLLASDRIEVIPSQRDTRGPILWEKLHNHKTLVVNGGSQTIERYADLWRRYVGKKPALWYGPKRSIAIHDAERVTNEQVDAYFNDIVVHDGLGCLNTTTLYVKADTNLSWVGVLATRIAEHYKGDMKAMLQQATFVQDAFSLDSYLGASGPIVYRGHDTTQLHLAYGYGTLYVVGYRSLMDVWNELEIDKSINSSATLFTDDQELMSPLVGGLIATGFTRICSPGEAQRPKLGWKHDGKSNIMSLTNYVDVELEMK